MEEGRIICTKNKTGHALLVEGRFEFPGGEYREQQTALQEGKYFNIFRSKHFTEGSLGRSMFT